MSLKGIHPSCYSCIIQQVRSAAKTVSYNLEQEQELLNNALEFILKARKEGLQVQHIIRYATDYVQKKLHKDRDFDLYSDIKRNSHERALSFITRFTHELEMSSNPISYGIRLAAAGNIIDFGAKAHGSLNIEQELNSIDSLVFGRTDEALFIDKLRNSKLLLYIADNVGEILFDRLLIKALKQKHSDLNIIVAVRDKPIINDATLDDAFEAGLFKEAKVISSGSVLPGTILGETSEEFQNLFKSADLIVSKGQGNFETLLSVADNRVFFLLRIKCETMASLAQQKTGDLVFMQGR